MEKAFKLTKTISKTQPIKEVGQNELVFVSGKSRVEELLQDEYVEVEFKNVVTLKRQVEAYQVKQLEHKDDEGRISYSYERAWSALKLNSDAYNDASQKLNPKAWPLESVSHHSELVRLNQFALSPAFTCQLSRHSVHDLQEGQLSPALLQLAKKHSMALIVHEKHVYLSQNYSSQPE